MKRTLSIAPLPAFVRRAAPFAFVAVAAPAAGAQVTFSLDWKGPTISQPATGSGLPITEADLLLPGSGAPQTGPQPVPRVRLSGAQLGLPQYPSCAGHPPGTPCGVEVDALSEGRDEKFRPEPTLPGRLWFSVDEFAKGHAGTIGFAQVFTEAPVGDSSADLFVDDGLPPGPLGPGPVAHANVGTIDGNGQVSPTGFVYPGLGLVEPNPPGPGPLNPGDNIDGLDIDSSPGFPQGGVFFSLDGAFFDPLANVPNSNSAQANGPNYQPGDVLRTPAPGATPVRYATAQQLGLDQDGPGKDDLDALILVENGDGIFQRSQADYDWIGPLVATDMLMFSVRRGSSVIGKPDCIFGLPIEPGDILVPPRPGGLSPFPGIWIAAENLGLETARMGTVQFGDDVDALDRTAKPLYDCNKNGVEDSVDIAVGSSMDSNLNGIPDECENDVMGYCYCITPYAPCGNGDPYPTATAGCHNSTGVGGRMIALGTTSVANDDLRMHLSQLPLNKVGIIYMSPNGSTPTIFGDGAKCPVGPAYRYMPMSSGTSGTMVFGPGLASYANSHFPLPGHIVAGSSFHFQGWYRDPTGPCGSGKNLTNAVRINFTP